jgi:hypothetical protein
MHKNVTRKQLEQNIIERATAIRLNPETGCYDEDVLHQAWEAWHELVNYYDENEDTEISVEVVRVYLDKTNSFFSAWQDPDKNVDCQERAEEALRELEAQLRYIVAAVERRLYPDGR